MRQLRRGPADDAGGVHPAGLGWAGLLRHKQRRWLQRARVSRPAGRRSPGSCSSTACAANIDGECPQELQYTSPSNGAVIGCKSACLAFNTDQYCCRGAFGSPSTCKPTNYSQFFKNACPQAYSYAYDDSSSTFTCTGANYLITYCPN
uniref:Thaumatin-like protein n=1 Tax=Ananas comosus var. bracteatus TaxID=296719 RepID=A0A6V7QLX7_ANACO|nr:unnamed protein product [Ananas comosus var. bracteatus]